MWIVLGWALAGGLLGCAFRPMAERLGATHRAGPPAVSALATSLLFGLLAWRVGIHIELLACSCVALAAVPLAVTDLAELRLPRPLVLSACATTVALLALAAAVGHDGPSLLRAVAAMLALPLAYLALALVSRGGIGGGDVRLAALVGLVLGWRSWPAVVAGTMIALGYGCILAIALGGRSQGLPVPYGPAMLAGAFTVVIAS